MTEIVKTLKSWFISCLPITCIPWWFRSILCLQNLHSCEGKGCRYGAYNQHFDKGTQDRCIGSSLRLIYSFFLFLLCIQQRHFTDSALKRAKWFGDLFYLLFFSFFGNSKLSGLSIPRLFAMSKLAPPCHLIWLLSNANGGYSNENGSVWILIVLPTVKIKYLYSK